MEVDAPQTISWPGFIYDACQRRLFDRQGQPVALRPQTLAMLHALACRADRIVDKDDLLREVWPGLVVTDDSLVQCIRDLRRTIGDEQRQAVRTEPRRGYRLVATPRPTAAPDADASSMRRSRRASASPWVRKAPASPTRSTATDRRWYAPRNG